MLCQLRSIGCEAVDAPPTADHLNVTAAAPAAVALRHKLKPINTWPTAATPTWPTARLATVKIL